MPTIQSNPLLKKVHKRVLSNGSWFCNYQKLSYSSPFEWSKTNTIEQPSQAKKLIVDDTQEFQIMPNGKIFALLIAIEV